MARCEKIANSIGTQLSLFRMVLLSLVLSDDGFGIETFGLINYFSCDTCWLGGSERGDRGKKYFREIISGANSILRVS